jgi:hypothetical protein
MTTDPRWLMTQPPLYNSGYGTQREQWSERERRGVMHGRVKRAGVHQALLVMLRLKREGEGVRGDEH